MILTPSEDRHDLHPVRKVGRILPQTGRPLPHAGGTQEHKTHHIRKLGMTTTP